MAVKILVVSRFPPDRDGIASYAVQVVMSLRREGHTVDVVSSFPSAAAFSANFHSNIGLMRILLLSWRRDRTIVEFVADHFFKSLHGLDFLIHWPAFVLFLLLGRRVELVMHESPHRDLMQAPAPKGWLVRAMWRTMVTVPAATLVHTEWERAQLASAIRINPKHIDLLDHGRDFVRRTRLDRRHARLELGLPLGQFIFLCIGFLQSHKGFDRAVLALRQLPEERMRLEIVGAMRVPAPEIEAYVHQLRMLVAATPRAHLHEGYVTDELFDRWIVAADVVVLPYRDIWSSGVLERAKLYGRPLIVSDAGGLPEQAGIFARVATSEDELAQAMADAAGVSVEPRAQASQSSSYIQPVFEEVRQRAAALRMNGEREGAQVDGFGDTVAGMSLTLRLPFVTGSSPRALLKRAVAALTRWELRPIVNRVNDLQFRTDARIVRLQREIDELKLALAETRSKPLEPARGVSETEPAATSSEVATAEIN